MLLTVMLLGKYPLGYHAAETNIFSARCTGIGVGRFADYCSAVHANY
jgi:hypothetical protein